MLRRHIKIEGLVQGVWFRVNTQREAQRLGLHGWVMNTPDGKVEAEFEGPSEAVEEVLEWCSHGPETARVTGVIPLPPTGERAYASFDIR